MGAAFLPSAEEVDQQLEQEFMDDVRDTISNLDILLGNFRSGQADATGTLAHIVRSIHTLKNQGRGINLPLINLVVHRLDDYLADLKELTIERASDIQAFLDKINGVLDGDIDETSLDAGAQLVRELPSMAALEADFGDLSQKVIEIMVIVPEKAMSRILRSEMAACGYRTTTVANPFNAFEMAVRVKPDLILASMELGEITGLDLACGFAAMPTTSSIPFALLTSYDHGHPALRGLPTRAALLKKGQNFGDGLADALSKFGIT